MEANQYCLKQMYTDKSQHSLIRFDWTILQEFMMNVFYLNELAKNAFLKFLFYFIVVPVEDFSIKF